MYNKRLSNLSFISALKSKCPYCGAGNLYAKYYTLNEKCSHCNRSFETISNIGVEDEEAKVQENLRGFVYLFKKQAWNVPDNSVLTIGVFIHAFYTVFAVLMFAYCLLYHEEIINIISPSTTTYGLVVLCICFGFFVFTEFLILFLSFPIIRSFKIHSHVHKSGK